MKEDQPMKRNANANIDTTSVVHLSGNETVSGSILPQMTRQNQILQVSNTSPVATYINSTTPTFTEIVTENNIGEMLIKALDKMSVSSLAELKFRMEMIGLDEETRREYEILLKLYDYDYEKALCDVIKAERDKTIMKYLEKK